ncbi:pyridoxal-5'-phosphate-dependent protein [Methanobrevibacter sp. 87.7]|uniref:DegT/DnrJ/EryC1/StrS family aminotransferase n=1 Tax=Methanobrevibacter sp. 87.7 TaxID=387957 RepID=UPI000B502324|nr:DegT/DnrJ/EryC1/StrS family aminotransferase [Methanobrevibacter sp. 87.7]OWT33057.1 pyridoxal-5'-phosphate-dependent protein [Methanobrevibacter sp. 87.7]
MDLKFKKSSEDTRKIKSEIALGNNPLNIDSYIDYAEDKIKDTTNHDYAHIVSSGNAGIFIGLSYINGDVLIPDQGGWNGFKQISRFLNKPFETVKTNLGLIDIDELNNTLSNLDKSKVNGLILTSFAAYTAEQNIKEISEICHENDVILIEDVSGSIGDSKLANGKYSDIIVGSTGSPKILNVEDGGFITTNIKEVFDNNRILLKSFKSNEITAGGIISELKNASSNLNKYIDACNYLKNNIDNVVHADKRGINVFIKNDDPKHFSWNLRQELVLDSHGMVTKCPNYNRLKEKGVALEIKNLDISQLSKSNLDEIIEIVKKYQ